MKKNADDTYDFITKEGKTVKVTLNDLFTSDYLTRQNWLDTDVMMQTFKAYSSAVDQVYEYASEKGITASQAMEELGDQVDAFGLKAFKSAQEARTWADVLDSVKDAVSTGWMNTFQNIFGDYEEAKTLWTDLANELWDVFASGGEARNEILAEWKKLDGRNLLFGNTEEVTGAFWNIFYAIRDVLNIIKDAARDIFGEIDAKKLYDLTKAFQEFTKNLTITDTKADKLKRTFKGLFAAVDIVVSIFKEAFKAALTVINDLLGKTNVDILDTTASVGDAIVAFRDWLKTNNVFSNIFGKIGGVIKTVIGKIKEFVSYVISIPEVAGFVEKVRIAFSNFFDTIKDHKNLENLISMVQNGAKNAFSNLGTVLGNAVTAVRDFLTRIREANNVSDVFAAIKDTISSIITSIGNKFSDFGTAVSGVFDKIKEFAGGVSDGASNALGVVSDFVEGVKARLSELNLDKIIQIAGGVAIFAFIKKLFSITGSLKKIVDVFDNAFSTLGKAFKSFNKMMQAEAMVRIATAILMIVGALAVLTLLDQDKLINASIILGALTAGLITISLVASKIKNIQSAASGIIMIAGALLIMALAIKSLENMDASQIAASAVLLAALGTWMTAMGVIATRLLKGTKEIGEILSVAAFFISFAVALRIMASAIQTIANLDISDMDKVRDVLMSMVTSLALVSAAASLARKGSAATILAAAASIYLIIGAIKKIAQLNPTEALTGLSVVNEIFGMLAQTMAIIGVTNSFGKGGKGGAIIALSASILIIVAAIKMISGISASDLAKGKQAITEIMTVMTLVVAASHFAGEHAQKAGVMLLAMSVSIGILAAVIWALSLLEPEGLERGKRAIEELMLIFGVILGVSKLAEDAKGTIIALTVAITLLSASIFALSLLEPSNVKNASEALSLVIAMFALLVASTGLADKATGTIVLMMVVVGELAGIIALLSLLPTSNALEAAEALSLLLLSMSASMVILGNANPLAEGSIAGMALLGLVVAEIGAILVAMSALGIQNGLENAAALSLLLVAMSGSLVILGAVGSVAEMAIAGMGVLALFVAELLAIIAGLGALVTAFPEVEEFINTGIPLLEKLGYGLGAFFGNIIGGFTSGLTSGLPKMGEDLSKFGSSIQPFLNTVSSISEDSMRGVDAIARLMLTLAAAEFIDAITSITKVFFGATDSSFGDNLVMFGQSVADFAEVTKGVSGDDLEKVANAASVLASFANNLPKEGGLWQKLVGTGDLSKFGAELESFGPHFAAYAESVSSITNTDAVIASATAAKALADFANNLPKHDGIWQEWVGDSSLTSFAQELSDFAPALVEYAKTVDGLNADVVTNSVTAATALKDFAASLPAHDGIWQSWVGDASLTSFAKELESFAPALMSYAQTVDGLDAQTVTDSVTAAEALSALANGLPDSGGLVSWFAGDNTLEGFSKGLPILGQALHDYANNLGTSFDPSVVVASVEAARALSDLESALPDSGGIVSWFAGDNTLSQFASGLADFGLQFSNYYTHIQNVDPEKVKSVVEATSGLVELCRGMGSLDTNGMKTFSQSLKNMGETGLNEFVAAFDNGKQRITDTAVEMINTFDLGILSQKDTLKYTFETMVDVAEAELIDRRPDFTTHGTKLMEMFIEAISNKNQTVMTLFHNISGNGLNKIKNRYPEFKDAGTNVMSQFINGVQSKQTISTSNFVTICNKALTEIKNKYTEFYNAGVYLVDGFANGITAQKYAAEAAARAMAKSAADAAKNELDINSPSRVGAEIGAFFGQGFVDAILGYSENAFDSGIEMGAAARDGLNRTIADISRIIESDIST